MAQRLRQMRLLGVALPKTLTNKTVTLMGSPSLAKPTKVKTMCKMATMTTTKSRSITRMKTRMNMVTTTQMIVNISLFIVFAT